ncbi:MAG: trypsin-like peptidase domain-containing protein [Lachnospiraceae bacterium]|nr:trypsin-like peptidase domain-containing protein [Lachnospiraceae bacterium]
MYEQNEMNSGYTTENGTYQFQAEGTASGTAQNKKKKGGTFRKIRNTVAYGLVFGLTAGGVFTATSVAGVNYFMPAAQNTADSTEEAGTAGNSTAATTTTAINAAYSDGTDGAAYTVSEIASNCMPSIVSITNKGVAEVQSWFGTMQQESTSAGSGIIVSQNDTELLIATNNHVVADAEELSVCFNDSEDQVYSAYVKGTDSANDLAIVGIKLSDIPSEVMSTVKIAALGDSNALQIGDQVVAIGNALGYGQSVTSGYVSALDRAVTIENMTASLIQTDAAINPGNSGGALFNMKGEVIGINSAKFASSQVEGMGYAIPISTAQPILTELESRETRDKVEIAEQGSLGITCMTVASEAATTYGIPQGVYVTSVTEGSAADKAGLVQGDVITKFDGQETLNTDDLIGMLEYYSAGETVEMTVQRMASGGYDEQTINITLQQKDTETETAESSQRQDQGSQNYGNPFPFTFNRSYGN